MSNEAVLETDEQGEIHNEWEEKKEYLQQEEDKEEEKEINPLLSNDDAKEKDLIANLQKEELMHIYSRLKSLGLSTRHLRSIEAQDLKDLCTTLQLSLVERIKFKSIVHDIKQTNHRSIPPKSSMIKNEERPIVSNINNCKEKEYDYLIKVIIIGDSGVGKSCLLLRYADWCFSSSYISTIGVDFRIKTMKIDDDIIKLQVWDTAGQERFRTITTSYYRGTHAIISCYDITDRESFENCKNAWMQSIEQQANPDVFVMIAGLKKDLKEKRQVSFKEGKQFAESIGDKARFCEVSALTGFNVNGLFNTVAVSTLKLIKDRAGIQNGNGNVNLNLHDDDSWWNFATSASCC